MIKQAEWIYPKNFDVNDCPEYKKEFSVKGKIKSAFLYITAGGVYEALLNGERVGNFVLAPGWTNYEKRHQYQKYDITDMTEENNTLQVVVATGWHRFMHADWFNEKYKTRDSLSLIALIQIIYENGEEILIPTDESWVAGKSKLLKSDIYNGCEYDASKIVEYGDVEIKNLPKSNLIFQEGEIVCEQERIKPVEIIITPKGETVLDFGQNMTGYVEFFVDGKKGNTVKISHAEILDKDGNFYTENYRSAKALSEYICCDGKQIYKPTHNFFGFRYIRIDSYPNEVKKDNFTAIVVHSDLKRTGYLRCGNTLLNKLFSNIIWGQKGNFLDIPTDCPQRDERLGWTGDAQVFVKTASYNYDVKKFFEKWLKDLKSEQFENGLIPYVVPNNKYDVIEKTSAAWGDASVICPWQIYLTYGDKTVLENQFESMKKWIDYITAVTKNEFLWTGSQHFGDWLGMDAEEGSYKGSSDDDFIASAFYAYSTSIVVEAGKVLGENVEKYETLYENIVKKFKETYKEYKTQTEHVLAIHFSLCDDIEKTAKALAKMIEENGNKLTTGFVGTPYLLYALSEGGYTDVAYSLLLQTEYPSWLFSVRMGATTIWEHWDGIREDGSVWSSDMNSYNHYAYGSVASWVYEVAGGINTVKEYPGFEKVVIKPQPDKRMGYLEAKIETKKGTIRSYWEYVSENTVRYEISVPVFAEIVIDNEVYNVEKGDYIFYGNKK